MSPVIRFRLKLLSLQLICGLFRHLEGFATPAPVFTWIYIKKHKQFIILMALYRIITFCCIHNIPTFLESGLCKEYRNHKLNNENKNKEVFEKKKY